MTRTYIAVHTRKGKVTVEAESSYSAQVKAADAMGLKPNKRHEVSVYLADVVHSPNILGA